MNTCIKVKDLTKSFGERVVVDKITFRVESGQCGYFSCVFSDAVFIRCHDSV